MSYKHFPVENFQAHIDVFILDGRYCNIIEIVMRHQNKTG